jgi:hypothetical protein
VTVAETRWRPSAWRPGRGLGARSGCGRCREAGQQLSGWSVKLAVVTAAFLRLTTDTAGCQLSWAAMMVSGLLPASSQSA